MNTNLSNQLKFLLEQRASKKDSLTDEILEILAENDRLLSKEIVAKSLSSLMDETVEDIKQNKTISKQIKSKFRQFDEELGGFNAGEFVVIGARPGMGKTTLLINLALNISKQHPVLFFSFDHSTDVISKLFFSVIADVPCQKVVSNKLDAEEKSLIFEAQKKINEYNVFFNDTSFYSITQFKQFCEEQVKAHNIKVLFIDYLQLMQSKRYRHNRELEMSYISREIKILAKELDIVIIASSQLSRAVESRASGSKRPMLSDLRESGAIEQDADKVIFLYRPYYYGLTEDENGNSTKGRAELIVAKNKYGANIDISLQINANFTRFTDRTETRNDTMEFQNTSSTSPNIISIGIERLKELDDPF